MKPRRHGGLMNTLLRGLHYGAQRLHQQRWMFVTLLTLSLSAPPTIAAIAPLAINDPNDAVILAEVERLKNELTALHLSANEQESVASLLTRSERAAQAGHTFLSLHILEYAVPLLVGYKFQHAHGKAELSVLEQEYRRLGPELTARQQKLASPQRLPQAVQAVLERALIQVQPNYQASLMYGKEAGIEYGLMYLGLAQGQLDFVAFCRTLKFAAPAATPLPAPASALAAMEAEVLAAYRQFDTPEQHSAFIRVNSALKVAQDLAQAHHRSGEWLQVFEARRALTAILIGNAENRDAAALRQQSAAVRAQLTQAAGDQSLGWLYWQMAETALGGDDLKSANAILHHVLPAYFQSLMRSKR